MRKTFSIVIGICCGLSAVTFAASAAADVLVMPPAHEMPPNPIILPHRGQSLGTVLRDFGEPKLRHAAVGGGTPKHPPITRWDYDGYSVFFEHTTVVDVVIKGEPPPIANVDELHPAR